MRPDGSGNRVLASGTRGIDWYASPSLAADGKRLAYVFKRHAYAADGNAQRPALLSNDWVDALSVRRDGARVLLLKTVPYPGCAQCPFGVDTGTVVDWSGANATSRPGAFGDADWLSRGQLVASSAQDNRVLLRMPAIGCCGRLLFSSYLFIYEVAASPDGKTIAVSAEHSGSGVGIYLISRESHRAERLTPRVGNYASPAWSPDGRWLVFVRAARGQKDALVTARAVAGSPIVEVGVDGDSPTWGGSG